MKRREFLRALTGTALACVLPIPAIASETQYENIEAFYEAVKTGLVMNRHFVFYKTAVIYAPVLINQCTIKLLGSPNMPMIAVASSDVSITNCRLYHYA